MKNQAKKQKSKLLNMQKTTSNKIVGTVKSLSRRAQIVQAVKDNAPYATVKFRPRGNGASTKFSDADYYTVTVQMGNAFLSAKSIKNISKYVSVVR